MEKAVIGGLKHQLQERLKLYGSYAVKKKELEAILAKLPEQEVDNPVPEGNSNGVDENGLDKELKAREEKLKKGYNAEINLLKEKLLNEGMAQQEYQEEQYKAEMAYLWSRKALLVEYGKDSSEIQGQIYDKMIAEADRLTEASKEADKNAQSDNLATIDEEYQLQRTALKQAYIAGDIKREADYLEQLKDLEYQYLEERRDMLAAYGEDISSIDAKLQDMDLADGKENKNKQREQGFKEIDSTSSFSQKNDILQSMYDADLITYEEYQAEKTRIEEEYEDEDAEYLDEEEYEDEDEDDYQIDDELDEDHKEDFDFEKESALDIDDHDSDEDDGDFADLDSFEDEEELDSSDDYLDLEFDEKPAPEPKKETSKSAPTPDIDEVLEIEEPSEDEITERMGKFDTGFVVQGRYDLSATSEIGLKLGLTEEQKQLFSYFVPIRGVSEQLVEILDNDKRCRNRYGTSRTGNILILGRKGSGKTVLAVDIVKAIQKQRRLKQGKVAIVTGDSLNKKDIGSIIDKLNGGALIIEKASKMNDRTIRELNDMMDEQTGELLFLLEDQKKPLERMFASHREFKRKFTSRLELPVFINDELVTFGQTYAKENGYRIDEMGILALYSRIDMMQREDHAVTVAEVKEIMDEAISHSQKANVKHLVKRVFGRNTDNSDHIILKEDDFKS